MYSIVFLDEFAMPVLVGDSMFGFDHDEDMLHGDMFTGFTESSFEYEGHTSG